MPLVRRSAPRWLKEPPSNLLFPQEAERIMQSQRVSTSNRSVFLNKMEDVGARKRCANNAERASQKSASLSQQVGR